MCLPIAKYKRIITTLETAYPSLIERAEEILIEFQEGPQYQSPVELEKIQLIIDLKTELIALRSYETEFVFPQAVLLLDQKKYAANIKIDFNQAAQLTAFKEEKIEKYSYQLQGLNNCQEAIKENDNKLNSILDIFLDDIQTKLLPLKRQWSFILVALANEAKGQNKQCGNTLNATCGANCDQKKRALINNL